MMPYSSNHHKEYSSDGSYSLFSLRALGQVLGESSCSVVNKTLNIFHDCQA